MFHFFTIILGNTLLFVKVYGRLFYLAFVGQPIFEKENSLLNLS